MQKWPCSLVHNYTVEVFLVEVNFETTKDIGDSVVAQLCTYIFQIF